ncbi:acetyltransferase [Vibrio injensis]|uniref:acetyltransferase n=1 Tax=Vibrio injensis TaxID=1307414 RepID=UPI000932E9BD|nr:acetyltransferase [Vibrio injensis]
MHYDVFNGDADGIIALLQLRLAEPIESQLVTGVKRDIQLLRKLTVNPGDSVVVLDISMAKNTLDLQRLLNEGARVFYADHHQSGDVPYHANLTTHIDLNANICTGLIIDRLLAGRFHHWAIAAAYGDNLIATANQLASQAGLTTSQTNQLQSIGTLLNYNGYGQRLQDLHFHPAELLRSLLHYPCPFMLIDDQLSPYYRLKQAYQQDIAQVQDLKAYYQSQVLRVFILPDQPASHRVSGVLGNLLANQQPNHAHLVLTEADSESYTVSLRAPLANKQGAGAICAQFVTGGGREAAGGINRLVKSQLNQLIEMVDIYYRSSL